MNNHDDENCSLGDDDHVVEVRVEFIVQVDEDGDTTPKAARVSSHAHNVPAAAAAQVLLLAAQRMIADEMAHTTFEDFADHSLKHALADAASVPLMKSMIDNLSESAEAVDFDVPNDLSELLGEE